MPLLLLLAAIHAAHVHRTSPARPCYAAQFIVVARDQTDRVVDRVVTTGIWRYDAAGDSSAVRCTPADSGSFAVLEKLLVQRLDSTSGNPNAHRSFVELRDTSLTSLRRTIGSIANGVGATRGSFHHIEVLVAPANAARFGAPATLAPLLHDSAQASACAAENRQLVAAAPFHWAC